MNINLAVTVVHADGTTTMPCSPKPRTMAEALDWARDVAVRCDASGWRAAVTAVSIVVTSWPETK